MTDTRFTTPFASMEDLVDGLDVDGTDDVETLLMAVLRRPVEVRATDDESGAFEVIVSGDEYATGTTYEFPLSVMELVRSCAESADEMGPYTRGGVEDSPAITTMRDSELIQTLQRGLGQVRLFNLLDSD